MQTKQFGKTGMQITPVGLGAWAIGGNHGAYGRGPQDDQESIKTIQRALDLGINWIDPAGRDRPGARHHRRGHRHRLGPS